MEKDDICVLWLRGKEYLVLFLNYVNTLDSIRKIKFTMERENGRMVNECLPRKSINNIPHGIALRLRLICDSDEKFKHRSEEYKNYLIARDYHPGLV